MPLTTNRIFPASSMRPRVLTFFATPTHSFRANPGCLCATLNPDYVDPRNLPRAKELRAFSILIVL